MVVDSALIAIIIWWCEGAKVRRDYRWKSSFLYPIEVTNTDPRIIKLFIEFLKDQFCLPGDKLKGQLQIHEGDNQQMLENFWSRETGIPISQFNKTIIRKNGTRRKKSTGTFKVRTYNKELFLKLQSSLDNILVASGV